ncbi:MAG: RNA polymerase sigma factor [Nitrospira sp.]
MSNFPITRWSLIEAARDSTGSRYEDALNILSERYWKPVYLYVRCRGVSHDDAKDLTQEFFTSWLDRGSFGQADQARGRFRSFLCASLKNFLVNAHRNAHADRRRPPGGFVAIEDLMDGIAHHAGPADHDTPEAIFDRTWTVDLLQRVLGEVVQYLEQTGQSAHREIFSRRIIEPYFDGVEPESMKALASRLGLSEKQVANHLLTVKRSFERLLRKEVRFYSASDSEIDLEVKDLLRALDRS